MANFLRIVIASLCIALACYAEEKPNSSVCPELFIYKTESVGSYEANLKTGSTHMPHSLSNVTIVLSFDEQAEAITSDHNLKVEKQDKIFTFTKPGLVIPPFTLLDLGTLTIKYKGNKTPRLTAYKLNGYQLCPKP